MKPLLISFSGGRTSAFMTKYLIERYCKRERAVVFANTGKERPETLDFINECDKRWNLGVVWVEALINPEHGKGTRHTVVSYETASRNGEPFEAMLAKYGIPNKAFPHCTRELKVNPMNSYAKTLGWEDWDEAIGIRADEPHRVKRESGLYYPLVDELRVDQDFIRRFWDKQDFDLKLKDYEGNCDFCWKKSDRKLKTLHIENPTMIEWWRQMERKYGKGEFTFFRRNRSADQIAQEATEPFQKAVDEHDEAKKQIVFDFQQDQEEACRCKST